MIRSSLIQAHKTTPIPFGVSRLASYNSWSPVKLVAVSQSQDNHIHSIELLARTGKLASHPPAPRHGSRHVMATNTASNAPVSSPNQSRIKIKLVFTVAGERYPTRVKCR